MSEDRFGDEDQEGTERREKEATNSPIDRNVEDLGSFTASIARGDVVALFYFFQQMDVVIDIVRSVSLDFLNRPHLYTKVDDHAAQILMVMAHDYGNSAATPERFQRRRMYAPILGVTSADGGDQLGQFLALQQALTAAAAAYAERVYDTGVDMLRSRVIDAARPFADYMDGVRGASLKFSQKIIEELAEEACFTVLRDQAVTSVFGVVQAPGSSWPYKPDSQGTKLIEAITAQTSQMGNVGEETVPLVTRNMFLAKQRLATQGAVAIPLISRINRDPGEAELTELIRQVYLWGAAYRDNKAIHNG